MFQQNEDGRMYIKSLVEGEAASRCIFWFFLIKKFLWELCCKAKLRTSNLSWRGKLDQGACSVFFYQKQSLRIICRAEPWTSNLSRRARLHHDACSHKSWFSPSIFTKSSHKLLLLLPYPVPMRALFEILFLSILLFIHIHIYIECIYTVLCLATLSYM